MSYLDRSTRNPNPIYNPYARKLPSDISPDALLSDDEEQTFSSYYEPKPRASRYGDVDGYCSDDMDDKDDSDDDYKNYYVDGMTGELHKYADDDCSSNCSAHDVTEEEVINWMIEDGLVRRSARIAQRVQKFGPTSYVEMNSGVRKEKVEKNKKVPVVEQKPVVDEAPVRRSARIARRAQKFGPTSYVGMDSIEPENEYDGITDIWYDYSVHYDSDYESPEEIKLRLQQEKMARWDRYFERKRAKRQIKQQLRDAKKANDIMDLDIQEQIAEDIAKLTLDTSNEEYFQILKLKQNTDQVLTWEELNFQTDYAISQMKKEQKEGSLDNMISQMNRIKAKLPPAVQQLVSIQQADKEIKDMLSVKRNMKTGKWTMN